MNPPGCPMPLESGVVSATVLRDGCVHFLGNLCHVNRNTVIGSSFPS